MERERLKKLTANPCVVMAVPFATGILLFAGIVLVETVSTAAEVHRRAPAMKMFIVPTSAGIAANPDEPEVYRFSDGCPSRPIRSIGPEEQVIIRTQEREAIAYKAGFECAMRLHPSEEFSGLILTLESFSTLDSLDNLTLRMVGRREETTLFGNLNENPANKHYYITATEGIDLYWRTALRDGNADLTIGLGFSVVATPYKLTCSSNETCFECASTPSLISTRFVCNGHNNCGDLSDECSCGNPAALKVVTALLAMTAGIAVLCIAITAVVWIVKKLKQRNAFVQADRLSDRVLPIGEDAGRPRREISDTETTPLCHSVYSVPG